MFEQIRMAQGQPLSLDGYLHDFEITAVEGTDGWKLEVQQTFEEPGNKSWEASVTGDWPTSIRLLEDRRDLIKEFSQTPPNPFHRVRVVERPFTQYLQWELRSLAMRAEYGEDIRVLDATGQDLQSETLAWPELVIIGDDVLYQVLYSETGALSGAIKFTDPILIADTKREIVAAFDDAQPISMFLSIHEGQLPSLSAAI